MTNVESGQVWMLENALPLEPEPWLYVIVSVTNDEVKALVLFNEENEGSITRLCRKDLERGYAPGIVWRLHP